MSGDDWDLDENELEKQALAKQAASIKQRQDDLEFLLKQPSGKRFIAGMLAEAGVFDKTFTGNSKTYYNEGRRSIGLELFHEIMDFNPSAFSEMWEVYQSALVDSGAKNYNDGD